MTANPTIGCDEETITNAAGTTVTTNATTAEPRANDDPPADRKVPLDADTNTTDTPGAEAGAPAAA